jgi:hypothetical protein
MMTEREAHQLADMAFLAGIVAGAWLASLAWILVMGLT